MPTSVSRFCSLGPEAVMIHQNRADRPSRTADVVEDTTPTIESCASATPTRRHSRRSSENTWCRGWESNPHRPEARGILRPRGKGGEQQDLSNSLPFPVSQESEECSRVRGLWTPRWTLVLGPLPDRWIFSI